MNNYKKYRIHQLVWGDVKKCLISSPFWFSAAALMAICFFNNVCAIENGNVINTWHMITAMTRTERLQRLDTSFLRVAQNVTGGYFSMFAPMITGITIIPLLCDERESGVFRFVLFRCGKRQTALAKLSASLLCGGLVIVAGYLMFLGIIYMLLPHGADYSEDIRFLYTIIYDYQWAWFSALPESVKYGLIILRNILGVFCFGAVSAGWTYFLSIFVTNRYLIACVPFMVVDFMQRKLSALFFTDTASSLTRFLESYVFPQSLLQMGNNVRASLMMLGIYLCVELLFWRIYCYVLERRVDCGQ